MSGLRRFIHLNIQDKLTWWSGWDCSLFISSRGMCLQSSCVYYCTSITTRRATCDVRWNGMFSHRFPVTNGVRQGAVSSPLLFSVYINNLVKNLRRLDIGCKIARKFVGVWIYCDDIFVLAGSRQGLQSMVVECERFALLNHRKFSTHVDPNKSKWE